MRFFRGSVEALAILITASALGIAPVIPADRHAGAGRTWSIRRGRLLSFSPPRVPQLSQLCLLNATWVGPSAHPQV